MRLCSEDGCGGKYYAKDLCQKHYVREKRAANPTKRDPYDQAYRERHKEEKARRDKIYREDNKERLKEYFKKYHTEHKDEKRTYEANKKASDINYRICHSLRNRIRLAIKNKQKVGSAVRDLGCSIGSFRLFIENQFEPGMSWDNYGQWHLDHVIPLSSFDLTDRTQFLDAANWLNYQPLWATDNIRKGSSPPFGAIE